MKKKPLRDVVITPSEVRVFNYFPGNLFIGSYKPSAASINRLSRVLNMASRKPSTRVDIFPADDASKGVQVIYIISGRVYVDFDPAR